MQIDNKKEHLGLDWYFKWKQRKRIKPLLEQGLLSPYWDDMAAHIFDKGYTWYTVRRVIEIARPFALFAESMGAKDASDLTETLVEQYKASRKLSETSRCLALLMSFFRDRGLILELPKTLPKKSCFALATEYLQFLDQHRGLSTSHLKEHQKYIQTFLETLDGKATPDIIGNLEPSTIFRFITTQAKTLSRSQRKAMCATVRSFLRFLLLRRYISKDLVSVVPVIPSFKLERVPESIDSEQIEKILATVDRSTPQGKRDYAILITLATYGIRSGQLCALCLDDIDWRHETLCIKGVKGSPDIILPLRPSVGEALVDYLRHGRKAWPCREVFLRVRAPIGPLGGNLVNIIKPYALKAGIDCPFGAHAWRHACATRMLAKGHSLKVIRDVLGHLSIEATFIYTKVDIEQLRHAALDWPGGLL